MISNSEEELVSKSIVLKNTADSRGRPIAYMISMSTFEQRKTVMQLKILAIFFARR